MRQGLRAAPSIPSCGVLKKNVSSLRDGKTYRLRETNSGRRDVTTNSRLPGRKFSRKRWSDIASLKQKRLADDGFAQRGRHDVAAGALACAACYRSNRSGCAGCGSHRLETRVGGGAA